MVVMERVKPVAGMVLVQVVLAGANILFKLALNDGMDSRVLLAYRYLFATLVLAPLAFFLERKSRPKMTWKVLTLAFLCGLFGCTLSQNLYLSCIRITSSTFASIMTNLIPAITFVLAVICRLESLRIQIVSGQAKVIGTLVGVGGAMLLTFYEGVEINLWPTHINLLQLHHNSTGEFQPHQKPGNQIMGSFFSVMSALCYAIWLIIQTKMSKEYPCHYTNSALICLMGMIQCFVYAIGGERNLISWRMGFDIRLLTVIYTGMLASALALAVMNWCIERKGPLFASVFNPLMLVMVAFLSCILLDEKLHLGSILGAILIVVGLYVVLWGKAREAVMVGKPPPEEHVEFIVDAENTTCLQAVDEQSRYPR